MNGNQKTILMSPLEWGLGHTVRLVPFIRKALGDGHQVILASDGVSLDFLRYQFPDLLWVRMAFYQVKYPVDGRFFRKLVPQVPGILCAIRKNHKQLARMVAEYGISEVISDHRYGMYHKNVRSIFITNQLWLKAPGGWGFAEGIIYRIHRIALKKFSEIWIADYSKEPTLSGLLTHPPRLPDHAKYIGPVSRFQDIVPARPGNARPFKVLALVSGPEPQRTLFENLLKERFISHGTPALILRGLPPSNPGENPVVRQESAVMLIDHARDEHLVWYIQQAQEIICRPGNSTLSDLTFLGKTALLVPTPGQTEQEYVAAHLEEQGLFRVCGQEALLQTPR